MLNYCKWKSIRIDKKLSTTYNESCIFGRRGLPEERDTESGKGDTAVIRIFRTTDGAIREIQEPQDGCWIALTNPTATEIFEISEQFQIEVDDLRAPLDEEERSRIEVEDTYTGV